MTTNSKIKTYRSYDEIPKADKSISDKSTNAPYEFLKQFYDLVA